MEVKSVAVSPNSVAAVAVARCAARATVSDGVTVVSSCTDADDLSTAGAFGATGV